MLVETDRDKYCVQRIIDLYHRQNTNYADYFEAAWRFKNRAALGRTEAGLADFAVAGNLSAKYLATIWAILEGPEQDVGPPARLRAMWRALPAPDTGQPDAARPGCEQMRDYVESVRRKVEPRFLNITAGRVGAGAQPFLIWKNVQYATHRLTFDPAQLQVEGESPPARNSAPEPGADGRIRPRPHAADFQQRRGPGFGGAGRAARPLRGGLRPVLPGVSGPVLHGGTGPELF